jgi:hypothetical protein
MGPNAEVRKVGDDTFLSHQEWHQHKGGCDGGESFDAFFCEDGVA